MISFLEARPVMVQVMVTTQNELGEEIPDWHDDGQIMAEIWPLTASQRRDLAGVSPKSTHSMYSNAVIVANTRIVDGGEKYLVGAPQNWGTHWEAVLERV